MSEAAEDGIELGRGTGPLRGVRVIEIAGIGPGPHACMLLADLGADVLRIDRPGGGGMLAGGKGNLLNRGRPSVALDLKNPDAVQTVLRLIETADVLVEGMRPGAIERLGLGPDVCAERNPALVFARMTGWGQDGPLAHAAGHDMNYISIAGALHALGQDRSKPSFPSNLLGDFGGGSTYLVIGILAALLEARVSGTGQVVDAAIVDGTAHLNTMTSGLLHGGFGGKQRAAGMLDGGAPFYDVYETADGEHLSVGALEPQFFAELIERLGLTDVAPGQYDFDRYDELRDLLTRTFKAKTQAEWAEIFEGTDACVAPILPLEQAYEHPHNVARETFPEVDGVRQPAPAPRFSRTQATLGRTAPAPGENTRAALRGWGLSAAETEALIESGAAVQE